MQRSPHNPLPGRTRSISAILATAVVFALVAALAGVDSVGAETTAPPTWSFSQQATPSALAAPGRLAGASGAASNGVAVLYGGQKMGDVDDPLGDTWTNDGNGWTARCGTDVDGATTPCGPGGRIGHAMASIGSDVLLFGGLKDGRMDGGGGTIVGDTWRWEGSSWTRDCDTDGCGPGPRLFSAMASNGTRVVLFGGTGPSGILSDTWTYDGTTWSQLCGDQGGDLPACGPAPLFGAAMAWDGTSFVLYGGSEGDTVSDATWTLADSGGSVTWTQRCGTSISDPCGPGGRVLTAITGTSATTGGAPSAVLVGGGDIFVEGTPATIYRDAWSWNGSAWIDFAAPWTDTPVVFESEGGPADQMLPIIGTIVADGRDGHLTYFGSAPTDGGTSSVASTWIGRIPPATSTPPATSPATSPAAPALSPDAARVLTQLHALIVFSAAIEQARFVAFAKAVVFFRLIAYARAVAKHRRPAAHR